MRLPKWLGWLAAAFGVAGLTLAGVWLSSLASDLSALVQLPSATSDARQLSSEPPTGAHPAPPTTGAGAPAELQTPAEPPARAMPPPPPGSWEATLLTGRARTLGRTGVDLEQGLEELQLGLDSCFRIKTQPSVDRPAAPEVDQPTGDDTGTTVVVLQVEAGGGELKVVDAPVEVRAGASDATIACIQEKLRGVRIASEARPPAPRFRLRYDVTP